MAVLTESARMSSAAEARFRLQTQPPTRRVVKVVALPLASDRERATVLDEARTADIVVMVAPAGADAHEAAAIGRTCSDARVMTTAVVIRDKQTTEADLARTLAQVRPWSLMVVVTSDATYAEDLLRSFR